MSDEHQHVPGILAQQERTCEECGRRFVIPRMDLWAYKIVIRGHTHWFCRYNCMRAGEKKFKNAKARGNKDLKSKKPSKEVLESDLRSGLSIAVIAKKHEGSVQSVHNWIKSYGLAGIQGQKKPKDDVPDIPETSDIPDMVQESPSLVEIEQFHTDTEVQELPKVEMDQSIPVPAATEDEISEMHARAEYTEDLQEDVTDSLSGEEFDRIMSTVEVQLVEPVVTETKPDEPIAVVDALIEPDPVPSGPIDEGWRHVTDGLTVLRKMYADQAEKDFRERFTAIAEAIFGSLGNPQAPLTLRGGEIK